MSWISPDIYSFFKAKICESLRYRQALVMIPHGPKRTRLDPSAPATVTRYLQAVPHQRRSGVDRLPGSSIACATAKNCPTHAGGHRPAPGATVPCRPRRLAGPLRVGQRGDHAGHGWPDLGGVCGRGIQNRSFAVIPCSEIISGLSCADGGSVSGDARLIDSMYLSQKSRSDSN